MTAPSIAFAAALSTLPDTAAALQEIIAAARLQLRDTPHLGFVFFSQHHAPHAEKIAADLSALLSNPKNLLGCNGEAIAGVRREVEESPCISLWLAVLPESRITTMRLDFHRTQEGAAVGGWPDDLCAPWPAETFLLVLGEPFSFPTDVLLEKLNDDRPGVPVAGGVASGGATPGANRLIWGSDVHHEGAVVAHISGGVRLRSVVSQGCRPIGKPFLVTKAERNVVYQLGGRPALERLRELFQTLPTSEQALVNRGLHLGRVVSEFRNEEDEGDFLIRNVIGGDASAGSIAVGDYLRVGQTVQFHVRDAASADAELRQLLATVRDEPTGKPAGALLFTCNGRGTRLFAEPHHDAQAIQQVLGEVPLAGFFAQGEIGPIGKQNFLHGFTASIALFEAP